MHFPEIILPRYRAVRSHEIAAHAPTQCKAYAILVEARFCSKDKTLQNFHHAGMQSILNPHYSG